MTTARTERTGTVEFWDAKILVRTEGFPPMTRNWSEYKAWCAQYKRDVFARVVQQLNRMGWTVSLREPKPHRTSAHDREYDLKYRDCRKGDLHGELEIDGPRIEFQMWQNLVTPNRPRGDGQYEFHKEVLMPHLIRLEMERTRRKLREYLCNVFGYRFEEHRQRKLGPGPLGITAAEMERERRLKSGHYRPELDRATFNGDAGTSGDGLPLENGMRVYAIDYQRRIITGTAYYCLNGNWTIVSGRYGVAWNIWHKQVFVNPPENLRQKRNSDIRRKRLEAQMAEAVRRMDFARAAVLRDVLWPAGDAVYLIQRKDDDLYHRPGHAGYTSDTLDAGRFTRHELGAYLRGGAMENDKYKAVPLNED